VTGKCLDQISAHKITRWS